MSPEKQSGSGTLIILLVVFALCLGALLLAPQKDVALSTPSEKSVEQPKTNSAVRDLHSAKDAEALMSLEGARGLLMVHAPWCGHCQNMMPAYEAAAEEVKASGGILARIEASAAGADFLRKEDIKGFPTILVLNRKERYAGGRTKEDLSKFVQSM